MDQLAVLFVCCILYTTRILAFAWRIQEGRKEMFYLTTHSTHFIYGDMASDIWLRTSLIVREETCCRHIGYSFRLTARVLLYAPSHRQYSTYHGLCYTSRGALAGTRNSSMGSMSERSYHGATSRSWSIQDVSCGELVALSPPLPPPRCIKPQKDCTCIWCIWKKKKHMYLLISNYGNPRQVPCLYTYDSRLVLQFFHTR